MKNREITFEQLVHQALDRVKEQSLQQRKKEEQRQLNKLKMLTEVRRNFF